MDAEKSRLVQCPISLSTPETLGLWTDGLKLFSTNAMNTLKICQDYFNFELPSSVVEKWRKAFVARYDNYCY